MKGWELHQIDIITAFLHGKLEPGEEVYMKQPKGFEVKGLEDYVWELLKGLYGLPQGSRIWNKAMNAGMASLGFIRISCKYCLYLRETKSGTIDLGEAKFCVRVAIEHDLNNHHIYLSQTALIDKILEQFNMTNCNPVSTPMEAGLILSRYANPSLTSEQESENENLPYHRLVGLLMYLAIATCPDIAFAVGKLSQFIACFNQIHFAAAKCVLHYLKGTCTLRLKLGGSIPACISGFSDASHACCPDSGKSTGAYCFFPWRHWRHFMGLSKTKDRGPIHLRL